MATLAVVFACVAGGAAELPVRAVAGEVHRVTDEPTPRPTQGLVGPGDVVNARSAAEIQTRLVTITRGVHALTVPPEVKRAVVTALDSAASALRVSAPARPAADWLWEAHAGLDSIAVAYSDEQAASLRDQVKDQIDALDVVPRLPGAIAGSSGTETDAGTGAGTDAGTDAQARTSPLDDTLAIVGGISGIAVAAAAVVTAFLAVRKHRRQGPKPVVAAESEEPASSPPTELG